MDMVDFNLNGLRMPRHNFIPAMQRNCIRMRGDVLETSDNPTRENIGSGRILQILK